MKNLINNSGKNFRGVMASFLIFSVVFVNPLLVLADEVVDEAAPVQDNSAVVEELTTPSTEDSVVVDTPADTIVDDSSESETPSIDENTVANDEPMDASSDVSTEGGLEGKTEGSRTDEKSVTIDQVETETSSSTQDSQESEVSDQSNSKSFAPTSISSSSYSVANTSCLLPSALGDTKVDPITHGLDADSLQDIFNTNNTVNKNVISDQEQYQVWYTTKTDTHIVVEYVNPEGKFISGLKHVFGFYNMGDKSSFAPLMKNGSVSGFESVPLLSSHGATTYFDVTGKNKAIGFAIKSSENSAVPGSPFENYSENSLNDDQADKMVAYKISDNEYVMSFEDLPYDISDTDYNDYTVRITVSCEDIYKNHPPVITLIGNNPLVITQNSTFTDPGASATDTEDGDLTSAIIVSGNVDTSVLGTTTLTYSVSDSDGATAQVTRNVVVVENTNPLMCTEKNLDTFASVGDYLKFIYKSNSGQKLSNTVKNTGILGGELDVMYVGDVSGNVSSIDIGGGNLEFNNSVNTTGKVLLVWDGVDGDATEINYNGLNSFNLSQGDKAESIKFNYKSDITEKSIYLDMVVYSNASNASKATYVIYGGDNQEHQAEIKLSSFTNFLGNGADFKNVGAITLSIDLTAGTGIDFALNSINVGCESGDNGGNGGGGGGDNDPSFICPLETKTNRIIVSFEDVWDGLKGGKIFGNQGWQKMIRGPSSTNIPAGEYKVTFVSYDDKHPNEVTQNHEQYRVYLMTSYGHDIIGPSADLPDNQTSLVYTLPNTINITETITEVYAKHYAYPNGSNDEDGVYPVCVAFDAATSTPVIKYPPVITLIGNNPLIITQNSTFTDPGASATDTEDGDLTSAIIVSGNVDTSVLGTTTLTYSVKDSDNNQATTTRDVVVEAAANTPAICSDNIDNDGDGKVDADDPGCHRDNDPNNSSSYDPNDGDETDATTPTNPPTNTGGSGGGSNGGGSSNTGGHRRDISNLISTGEILGATSCFYLRDYLRQDWQNDKIEVLKLQSFLNVFEGEKLSLSGVFDQYTFDAVSRFQLKYDSDILSPWGHDNSTGFVYILTKKKVNEIYCSTLFPVSASQQQEIDAFRSMLLNGGFRGIDTGDSIGSDSSSNGLVNDGLNTEEASTAQSVVNNVKEVGSRAEGIVKNAAISLLAFPNNLNLGTQCLEQGCLIVFVVLLAIVYLLAGHISRIIKIDHYTYRRTSVLFIIGSLLAILLGILAPLYCIILPFILAIVVAVIILLVRGRNNGAHSTQSESDVSGMKKVVEVPNMHEQDAKNFGFSSLKLEDKSELDLPDEIIIDESETE